jgi:F-type H+-transporting ATPase subunit b
MDQVLDTQPTMEVPPPHATGDPAGGGLLNVAPQMMMWTWVTFLLLCILLYKVAWKPILAALEQREQDLRKAVDHADQLRHELEQIEETRRRLITEADQKSRELVDHARRAAQEAARAIEGKAREEATILVENATREIRTAQEKAQAAIRRQSAELATALAGRILQEKLDSDKDRQLVDRLIRDL